MTYLQRFQRPGQEEAIKGRRRCTPISLNRFEFVKNDVIICRQGSHDYVAVTPQILGAGVHDNVNSEIQRFLNKIE